MKTIQLAIGIMLFVSATFACQKAKLGEGSPAITDTSDAVVTSNNSSTTSTDKYALAIAKSENGKVIKYEDNGNQISLSISNSGTLSIITNRGSYTAEMNEVENITHKMDNLSKQLLKRMVMLLKHHKEEDFSQYVVPVALTEKSVSPEGAIQLAFLNGSLSEIQKSVTLNRLGEKADDCISISSNAAAAKASSSACLEAFECVDTDDYQIFGDGKGVTICF